MLGGLTRHAEGPPQASGVLLALLELHPAHPDDLTDQEEAWPHQVAAAQVLEAEARRQRQDGEELPPTSAWVGARSP